MYNFTIFGVISSSSLSLLKYPVREYAPSGMSLRNLLSLIPSRNIHVKPCVDCGGRVLSYTTSVFMTYQGTREVAGLNYMTKGF